MRPEPRQERLGTQSLCTYLVAFIVDFRKETFTTLIKRAADLFIDPGDGGNQAAH